MLTNTQKGARRQAPDPRPTPAPRILAGRRPSGRPWWVILGCGAVLSLAGATAVMGRPTGVARASSPATPAVTNTGRGDTITGDTIINAVEMRKQAIWAFDWALSRFIWSGGLLTDEFRSPLNGLHVSDLPRGRKPVDVERRMDTIWSCVPRDIGRRLGRKDCRHIPERLLSDTAPDNGGREYSGEEMLDANYLSIQGARAYLSTVIGRGATAVDVVDELYAFEGYADLMLADLFCSGVPLNMFSGVQVISPWVGEYEFPFRRKLDDPPKPTGQWWKSIGYPSSVESGSFPYRAALTQHHVVFHPSATTAQVYQAALANFDTALSLAHRQNDERIANLSRVAKGRVWLALGQYDSAAAAVARVPRGFEYWLMVPMGADPDGPEDEATVADRKGRNGLPYISSGDPRTATAWTDTDKLLHVARLPVRWWQYCWLSGPGTLDPFDHDNFIFGKYPGCGLGDGQQRTAPWPEHGFAAMPLASWEEAVLIRAEAALHRNAADRTWLRLLNELRATAPIPGTILPDPAKLRPLKDPGTAHGRVALLFAERAYWLFLTGRRQGDLRRLVRNYHWPQDRVYPTGSYIVPKGLVGQVGRYGTDVNLPIAPQERVNPFFHGCLNRGA